MEIYYRGEIERNPWGKAEMKTDYSWVLHAIENAATTRAMQMILESRLPIDTTAVTVIGLNVNQIIKLKEYYEINSGKMAMDL